MIIVGTRFIAQCHLPARQKGAALLMFMMFLALGVTTLLLSGMSRHSAQLNSPFHNSTVLVEAKNAVIAYARLSDPDLSSETGLNYRYLPCPDQDGDGLEDSPCGSTNAEGWLPWMSLGLAPLRDASGACLRYFVSSSYKAGASEIPLITSLPKGDFTLSNQVGSIVEEVVAILIAPGGVVEGQNRGLGSGIMTQCGSSKLPSPKNQAVNYMDTIAGVNNAVSPDFINAPVAFNNAKNFNDIVMAIASSEL